MSRLHRRSVRTFAEGSQHDDTRAAELARLLPLWPHEIADTSREGRSRLVAKLHRALKAERRRGQAGHWTYDLARHAALLAAWRRERASLGLRVPCVARDHQDGRRQHEGRGQEKGRRPRGPRPRNP